MGKRGTRRVTHNYELKRGKRTVYRGRSKDPATRAKEHKRSGKRFTHVVIHPKVSQSSARNREKESILRYMRGHGGRKPQYNKRIG